MKLKLRLDKNAIQQFFIEHGEKIAFGVVVACSLFVIYRAMDKETFKKSPTELTNNANNLSTQIDRSPPQCNLDVTDYVEKAEQSRTLIKEDLYAYNMPWNPPLFEPPMLRSRPPLAPLTELRGAAGMGSFSVRSANEGRAMGQSNSTMKGQRWVVITGLVPVKEQIAAYKRAFSKVKDFKPGIDDKPRYVYYYVQRAEVGQGKPDAELQWEPVARYRTEKWTETRTEVVDSRYITEVNSKLVMPLGPLVPNNGGGRGIELRGPRTGPRDATWGGDGGWGDEVGHPKLKMARRKEDLDPGATEENKDIQEGPEFDGPDGTLDRRGGSGGLHNGINYGIGDYGLDSHRNVGGEETFEEPEHLLFRFFDFTVKPGKQYAYRARLMLYNPSSKAADKFLDEKLAKVKQQATAAYRKLKAAGKETEAKAAYRKWSYMLTDWCEPTEAIAVPHDTRLLAVSVTPPNRITSPPTAKLMVVKWLEEDGTEAYKEFPQLNRGRVLNFPNNRFPEISELKGKDDGKAENNKYSKRGRVGAKKDDEDEKDDRIVVDYMSESILLDMLGGNRLPGRDKSITAPAKVFLLDPAGNLVVRDELEDLEQYENRAVDEEDVPDVFEGERGTPGYDGYFEGFQ